MNVQEIDMTLDACLMKQPFHERHHIGPLGSRYLPQTQDHDTARRAGVFDVHVRFPADPGAHLAPLRFVHAVHTYRHDGIDRRASRLFLCNEL